MLPTATYKIFYKNNNEYWYTEIKLSLYFYGKTTTLFVLGLPALIDTTNPCWSFLW